MWGSEIRNELQNIYDREEVKTSTIFNMLRMNLELYNGKLRTLQQTRDLLEQITPSNEFNDWNLQYEAWKALTLTVEDLQVSVVIFSFLSFNLFFIIYEYCQTLSNTLKHFQTSIFKNIRCR